MFTAGVPTTFVAIATAAATTGGAAAEAATTSGTVSGLPSPVSSPFAVPCAAALRSFAITTATSQRVTDGARGSIVAGATATTNAGDAPRTCSHGLQRLSDGFRLAHRGCDVRVSWAYPGLRGRS